ncbi:MAG: isocitrate lyase/phosphoenolpyruvate mutase family protein [Pseudomonadota bacterium]
MSLKSRLGALEIVVAPGVYDALSALLAQQAGAEAAYLSGASIAYTRFGRPDIGLVTMTEVAEVAAAITDRIDIPLIVDADNGFGNALNVQRTVRVFERAGAAALQLEDQTLPKRCGHLSGKTLISKEEMAGKIRAAVDARSEALIIARTDAIAVEGFESALDRAEAYREAGADVLFIEAPRDLDEMRAFTARFPDTPLLANMVEGGKTPLLSAGELQALGFSIVIFPGGAVRFLAAAGAEYYGSLVATGSNKAMANRMHDFGGLNDVIGTDEMLALGKTYEGET